MCPLFALTDVEIGLFVIVLVPETFVFRTELES